MRLSLDRCGDRATPATAPHKQTLTRLGSARAPQDTFRIECGAKRACDGDGLNAPDQRSQFTSSERMSPAKRTTTRKRSSKSSKDVTDREETTPAQAPADENTEHRIRERAYEIYQARNGAAGDQVEDWLVAEREVRSHASTQSGAPMRSDEVSGDETRAPM